MKTKLSRKWLILRSGVEKYLIKNFDAFVPSSAGDTESLGNLTQNNINQIFPLLSSLILILKIKIEVIPVKKFTNDVHFKKDCKLLRVLFNKYHSDKSKIHNYHLIYGSLFKKRNKVKKVLEIGMGTNNEDIVSNMGRHGKPGEILIKEKRIKSFYVDQTNIKTLKKLFKKIGNNFDLVIDDGLHVSNANINVIMSSLQFIKKNGYLIIEDIPFKARHIWHVVSIILNTKYKTCLIKTKKCFVFIIKSK